MPETYHIAQEIQKYNIPDYRPRQEQYVFYVSLVRFYLHNVHLQIPESDQEGTRRAAHATQPRFRFQSNGERVTARPGAVDTSLRYLKGRRAAVWLLNDRQTMDNILTAYGRNLFASYHYTDMYSTVFFAFSLLIQP